MVCVRGENIEIALKEAGKYKSVNKIQQLNIPIVIPTVDINNEKEYIFTNSDKLEGDKYIKEIEIAKAVRASSSFPVLFAPFKYEKHAFIDGGVLNNVPVGELKKIGIKKTIAVNFISEENNNKKGIYNIALKTIDIMTNKIAEIAIAQSDYIIEPKVGHVKILAIDKMNECYQKGYEETIKKIVEIQSVLRGRRLAFKCCFF